ncbi:MAG: hypothetical protein WD810_03165 [Solirubrobacterales bacterium]
MRRLSAILAAALVLLLSASPAAAAFGFKDLDVTFTTEGGAAVTQAGSHPFAMTTTLGVNTAVVPDGTVDPETGEPVDAEVPEGEVKDLTIAQIPGFVGDQTAIQRCSAAEFATRDEGYSSCPDASAVGIAAIKGEFNAFPVGEEVFLHLPIYNLAPPPGVAARFGFVAANVPVTFDVGINESPPYNLLVRLRNIPQALLFYGSEVTLWGNPANSSHDSLRGTCVGSPTEPTPEAISKGLCPVSVSEKPLITLPRSCKGPLDTVFDAVSWQDAVAGGTATTHGDPPLPNPIGMTGCGLLPFSPEIDAELTSAEAESPAGIDFSIDVKDPGLGSSTGRAGADIAKVEATLPAGVTANPSAAEGLGVCTRAQYEAASLAGAGCPPSSKLGSVQIASPLLEESLAGSVFLAQQDDPSTSEPEAENPFDSLLAIYLVIRSSKYGISITQAGKIEPDPVTGQLVSTFEDIPELPFSHLNLRFREGPRAPLVTPPLCGTYTTEAILTPSSGNEPIPATSSFKVTSGPNGSPCPPGGVPPFKPGFTAGTINNNAGAYSPFYMRLTRADGEQDMTRFDSVLPPGVVGKIAGVAKCPEAAIAAAAAKSGRAELASPSCPESSRVGRVLAGAGVGPALTYVPGTIYLAGPYGGAPLSIAVVTPAVAGPFDVGTVITREALRLNPTTAQVEVDGAASDPIPHILEGIPLKLRDLRVYVDRPEFTLNATSCDEGTVNATLFGGFADVFSPADDVPASLAQRYQASNCASLKFKPKLTLKLKGGTKRGGFPALRAVVKARPGDANIGGAVVTLPHSAFLAQAHIRTVCTRVQFAAKACPKGSIYGRARAFTPLLDEPLEGPVYLRSSDHPLPDLVAALHGTVDIELVGRIDSVDARIRSSFEEVPDAPVTKFVLSMQGGQKGLIENSSDLCAHTQRAKAQFSGQNGKRRNFRPVVKAGGCGGKGKKTGKRTR